MINFPASPVVDQIYVYDNKTYVYTGKRWKQFTTTTITSSAIAVKDEGILKNQYVKSINFVGSAVTAESDVFGNVTVSVQTGNIGLGATGATGPAGFSANVSNIIGLTMLFGG
jgi:hypothetical protein